MSDLGVTVQIQPTKPFAGQKPGTSGLRKKVTEVKQVHYLENFVQCIFDSLPSNELANSTLIVSGDGRYYNKEAIALIIRMAICQRVGKLIIGINGLMSTPCVSGLIRSRKAYGGIILTASHNPGGPTEDFGIKYNCANGGPAPESLTNDMYKRTLSISEYKIAKESIDVESLLSKAQTSNFGSLKLEVIDATVEYANLMSSIFDFSAFKKLLARPDFTFVYDSMHGVAGPFAHKVFVDELGAKAECLMNAVPLADFGGGHPDPNLTYAEELVLRMGLPSAGGHGGHAPIDQTKFKGMTLPDFGAAADGDADRNMILGKQFFVTPSDSVAIIAAYANQAIPYFAKHGGVKGVARSMPTSAALDRVAEGLKLTCYEVPTGWKFFGNLMDAGRLSICGEESFGTGSDHIREKDGMWAVLAWLSIIEYVNRETKQGDKLVSVQQIVERHWAKYGRNYYSRYDYETVDSTNANSVMETLIKLASTHSSAKALKLDAFTVATADEFTYNDPVDKSVSAHQGIRFIFTDGSRIVYRLSGTGSVGATIRIYIEKYESPQGKLSQETATALAPLSKIALEISKIKGLTGRDKPTVIT